jgi:hypothetical protein
MGCKDGVASQHKFENKILVDLLMLSFCNLLYLPSFLVGKIICIKIGTSIRVMGPKYTKAKMTDQWVKQIRIEVDSSYIFQSHWTDFREI